MEIFEVLGFDFPANFVDPILQGFGLCDIIKKRPHNRFRYMVPSKFRNFVLEITALFEVVQQYIPENPKNPTQDRVKLSMYVNYNKATKKSKMVEKPPAYFLIGFFRPFLNAHGLNLFPKGRSFCVFLHRWWKRSIFGSFASHYFVPEENVVNFSDNGISLHVLCDIKWKEYSDQTDTLHLKIEKNFSSLRAFIWKIVD